MDVTLQPGTEAGRRFVEIAEKHAEEFAQRADEHDREGSFPFENWEAMRESGFLAGCIPEELGGLGVTSLHDVATGFSRLARGDASTAIGAHMHVFFGWTMARVWHRGGRQAAAVEALLRGVVSGDLLFTVAGTEAGVAPGYPLTEATAVDGGYRLSGRKAFGTNSPVATMFWVPCRVRGDDGEWVVGAAFVPRDTPGLEVHDDWDSLGMRASGSNSITLADCFVPADSLMVIGDFGIQSRAAVSIFVNGNLGLLGAFVGVAEAAFDWVVEAVRTKRKAPSDRPLAELPGIQQLVAEMQVDLSTCRAVLERICRSSDELFAGVEDPEHPDAIELMREFQCAKLVVNRKAIEVVDRALTASGGAGYMNRSGPLARLYRDVRAGPFMQPYSPVEAYEFVARATLGLDLAAGM